MTNFIPWAGGEQPVPDMSKVHVRYRDPRHTIETEEFYAQDLDWVHDPNDPDYDIVEYAPTAIQPVFSVWAGGENPLPEKIVEVVMRDSNWVIQAPSNMFDWSHTPDDTDSDILFYREV